MPEKPKLSMYWASSCGGCEIALVNLHEKILEIAEHFDFFFCPCLLDTKYRDVEALDDGAIALTFFNGAIRSAENQEMAHLLRKKSRLLVAYGACSSGGCIPALSNLSTRDEHIRTNYLDSPSLDNPMAVVPQTLTVTPEGDLELPAFFETVKTLSQVVEVDYFLPGCPPESHQIWAVMESLIQGKPLPPRHSVLGAGHSTVCEECRKPKTNKAISTFHRTYEIMPDPGQCLLEQGLVCMGVATRNGCGALCPEVNMPCTGCYGPPEGVVDSGARMLSALGSVLDLGGYKGLSEGQVAEKADAILAGIPDPAGTFYKYSLASSILQRAILQRAIPGKRLP
jgi:F420-non-reducing hydrogenase small subunit